MNDWAHGKIIPGLLNIEYYNFFKSDKVFIFKSTCETISKCVVGVRVFTQMFVYMIVH